MPKGYVLYNPLAGDRDHAENRTVLEVVREEPLEYCDMTRMGDYRTLFAQMDRADFLVLMGGDGTLNRFVNDTEGMDLPGQILYFPTGTGNDFALDVGEGLLSDPFPVEEYLRDLPTVEVKGKKRRFLNGVGFGIDGYCCQVGDELKQIPGKTVNYAAIAVKGLLFHFRPANAVVTVDGREYKYNKVWIAPTMHGRYYGGGMMAAPDQNRQDPEGKLSLVLIHGAGRLRTLCAFPGIFKGTHVRRKAMVEVLTGHEITVEFDRPCALQIDGETVWNVTEYTARSSRGGERRVETLVGMGAQEA